VVIFRSAFQVFAPTMIAEGHYLLGILCVRMILATFIARIAVGKSKFLTTGERFIQIERTVSRKFDIMSHWHGNFWSRFSDAHPLAMNELRKHRDNLDPYSLSEYDRGLFTMLALCFTVTDSDANYLRRLSISNYSGHLGYLDHVYWLYSFGF